eukprot:6209646-Pleurochrysis_carterae.AAC.1
MDHRRPLIAPQFKLQPAKTRTQSPPGEALVEPSTSLRWVDTVNRVCDYGRVVRTNRKPPLTLGAGGNRCHDAKSLICGAGRICHRRKVPERARWSHFSAGERGKGSAV